MIPIAAIGFAIQAMQALPQLVAAGMDIAGVVNDTSAKLTRMQDEKRGPTDAEWAELNASIRVKQEALHKGGDAGSAGA